MSAISITRLYDALAIKLGKENAENLTTFIDNKINQGLESKTNIFATKEDIAKLDIKISNLESKLTTFATKEDFAKLDIKISNLEGKTDTFATKSDLSETKSEMIKWMFIFWACQVLATVGLVLVFINK